MDDKLKFITAFKNVTGIKPKLNENFGTGNGFITDKVEIDFYNLESWPLFQEKLQKYPDAGDFELNRSTGRVNWIAELQSRSWGIDGISIAINSIYFVVLVRFLDNQGDLIEEEELIFDSKEMKEEFLPSIDIENAMITKQIYPQLIEIDFGAKKYRVNF